MFNPSPGLSLCLIAPAPPPTPPQLSALRFKLSPELCCACACLQPCLDSGLWFAVTGMVNGLWKKHLSSLPCLYWPHSSDLPVAPCCLKAASWQLWISYPSLLPGSGVSISSAGFATAVLPSVCRECAAGGWRGCLEENPFVATPGLVWGHPVTSRAESILMHVSLRRVDWKEKPSFLSKQQLCSCTPRRECLPWLWNNARS